MRIGGMLTTAAVALLVLAGCSAAPADETADTQRTAPEVAEETPAPEVTPTPEPETFEATTVEQEFIELVRGSQFDFTAWDDDDLVAKGWTACELFGQGVVMDEMDLIDIPIDGSIIAANANVAGNASYTLCPEFDIYKN